jgi:DNA mismatch repair ATPase MutS
MIEPSFFDEQTESFSSFREVISKYRPLSVFGKKIFSNLIPLKEEELHAHFRFLLDIAVCEEKRMNVEHILEDFHEISASLASIDSGTADEVDLFEIKRFIHHQRALKKILDGCNLNILSTFDPLWLTLDPQKSGSYIFYLQNSEIEELTSNYGKIQKEIEKLYSESIEAINERFNLSLNEKRFVIERTNAEDLIKSNLVMIEREGVRSYTLVVRPTEKILQKEEELFNLENALKEAQSREMKRITFEIERWTEKIREEIKTISMFDLSFAQIKALKDGYVFPEFSDTIDLDGAFHPIVKAGLEEKSLEYTTLTGHFDEGLTLIFGPNMGGKTTILRTLALSCALAMYGFPIPAKRGKIPPVEWIRFIGTPSENIDLSSFAVQIDEIVDVMKLEGRGLILIDEFGSGTNPYEGEALATALARYLSKTKNLTVMVTHFRRAIEGVECKKYTVGQLNFSEDITLQTLKAKIDHRLTDGALLTNGDALKLAKVLGIPKEIFDDASKILELISTNKK